MKIWQIVVYLELANLLFHPSVLGQIVPDRTIGTTVTPNLTINGILSDRIDHGAIRGNNLFHSLQEFNIGSGRGAYFSNPAGITNIFSRITGSNSSQINGTLGVLGNANLYLLNPNGILFGQNARLDLKGSFLATTANQINFADGTVFSVTNPQTSTLLTISVPVGLQFGSNPGPITVLGIGQNINSVSSFNPQKLDLNIGSSGLQVQPQKTLALIGGNLALNGGLFSAPSGQIELGSVMGGTVALNPNPQGWTLSYGNAGSFGNIQMIQGALAAVVDSTTGLNGGAIQIQGKQINIQDGSLVVVQNQGNQIGGDININATGSLQIIGPSLNFSSNSTGIVDETGSTGAAGKITINTPQLTVDQGGQVLNRSFNSGKGGDIILNITDELQVGGIAPGDPQQTASSISSNGYKNGNGGNIFLSAPYILVFGRGNIGSRSFDQGNGGNVTIKADTIQVTSKGVPPDVSFVSALSTSTFGPGLAGNETIDTRILSIQDGGVVTASSFGTGNSGTVTVNASEIELNGIKDAQNPSYIGAVVRSRGIFGLTTSPANSGNVIINTPTLNISNGAAVLVQNQGLGNAGSLTINAGIIRLDHGGNISASTQSGEGGNINLQIQDLLQMRHGSFISAEAGGSGNGGNLNINAPVIVGLENSDIIANALKGQGGNISIATQGIFLSPDSNITASSQLGISGTVKISNPNLQRQNILVLSTPNFASQEQVLTSNCLTRRNSQQGTFVVTGNGGLPETPDHSLISYDVLPVRAVHEGRSIGNRKLPPAIANSWHSGDSIQEATGLAFTSDGKATLVANPNQVLSHDSLICFQ